MQQDTLSNTEVPLKAIQNCPSLLKSPSILLSLGALSANVQYSPNQCSGVEEESVTPQLSPAKAISVPPDQEDLSGPSSRETGWEEIQRRGAFCMVVCSLSAGGLGVSECAFTGLAPRGDE
ncbi:hypothetical protein G5714_018168 [Onychostoma macrolepis]|uniref:Uncharacterized protein n=1 Tax=Onychostoma macrolepis TaxID=369639 RepID=A0A7J6C3F3_9TELE|nr:hypothetical protein G5714_018168 [Onychostoma macrolepis]